MTTVQALPERFRAMALAGYREIVAANRMLAAESRNPEYIARAEYAERRIADLEAEGVIRWEECS